jgi:peptidoglycan/LPS O-acetylase OafA/YrhL
LHVRRFEEIQILKQRSVSEKRLPQLDILRGIAILLVLGRHFPSFPIPAGGDFPLSVLNEWTRFGWIGVDLFFVLSGFLVSGLLFDEYKKRGRLRLTRFFVRRGFKIYPAFYFLLLVTAAFYHHRGIETRRLLTEALFVQNYFMGISNIWNHTWSLAIEEHFYLTLGLVLFFLARQKGSDPFRIVVPLFFVFGCGSLFLRLASYRAGVPCDKIFMQSHMRMDALFFGVLLSYFHHFGGGRLQSWVQKNRVLVAIAGVLCALPAFFIVLENDFFMNTFGLTLLYIGSGCLLTLFLYADPDKLSFRDPLSKILSFIGVYSYSIYLWHAPTRVIGFSYLKHTLGYFPGPWAGLLIYIAGSLIVGVLTAKMVEMPFLKLRDRLTT